MGFAEMESGIRTMRGRDLAVSRGELSIAAYRVRGTYGVRYYFFAGNRRDFKGVMPHYQTLVEGGAERVAVIPVHEAWERDLAKHASRRTNEVTITELGDMTFRTEEGNAYLTHYDPRRHLGRTLAPRLAMQEEIVALQDLEGMGIRRVFGSEPATQARVKQLEGVGVSHQELVGKGMDVGELIGKLSMGLYGWILLRGKRARSA